MFYDIHTIYNTIHTIGYKFIKYNCIVSCAFNHIIKKDLSLKPFMSRQNIKVTSTYFKILTEYTLTRSHTSLFFSNEQITSTVPS